MALPEKRSDDLTYLQYVVGELGFKKPKAEPDWEVAAKICDLTAQGKTIQAIFDEHKNVAGWPRNVTTHYLWMRMSSRYRQMYYAAQEDRAEAHVERMLELTEKVATGDMGVNEARLVSENLKWAAGKFKVKRFGERQVKDEGPQKSIVFQFNLGGSGEAPKQIEAQVRDVEEED